MDATTSGNPLKDLLSAGLSVGSQFALGKLFDSAPGDETAIQQEKVNRNKANGSGPVNAQGSMTSPKSWTDLFFGTNKASTSDAIPPGKTAGMSMAMKVAIVAAVVGLGWLLWKKS